MLKLLLITFSAVNQFGTRAYDIEHSMAPVTVADAEQIQETLQAENRDDANPTPQNEFDKLMRNYYDTLQATAGTGDRGQGYIEGVYGELTQFVGEHPEFKAQLPRKHIVRDDGRDGTLDGYARLRQLLQDL